MRTTTHGRKAPAAQAPREAEEQVVIEPSPGMELLPFDQVRAELARILAVVSGEVKPSLNKLIAYMSQAEDPRWDKVFEDLDRANGNFNDLFRSLTRAIGWLDPTHIEESR